MARLKVVVCSQWLMYHSYIMIVHGAGLEFITELSTREDERLHRSYERNFPTVQIRKKSERNEHHTSETYSTPGEREGGALIIPINKQNIPEICQWRSENCSSCR